MTSPIIAVLGTPKSGICILSQCLRMLGLTSLNGQDQVDISTIHGLLFQDLDHSPTMAGPIPQGWMQTPGAERAKQRVNALIADCRNETGSIFLSDPFLCRFMPLWAEAFQEAGLTAKFVLIVRHPWEAALSLARDENLDMTKAHLIWLAHVRDTLRFCQDPVIVSFDQLLADPVSILMRIGTELDLTWPKDPWPAYPSLLDFVQPNLKRHHTSNLPDKEKQAFQAYERLYHEIRLGQWSGMAGSNAVNLHPLPKPEAIQPTAKGSLPFQSSKISGPDLVDSLLDVVGQYEKQATISQAQQERNVTEPDSPLFAQIVFPSTRKEETVETIPLIADEWQHITLPVPEPTLLRNKPVILKSLNTIGTVHISAINLINRATGITFWTANSDEDFALLILEGDAIRLPDRDKLLLVVTGDYPRMCLPVIEDIPDCPLEIEVWIKASRDLKLVKTLLDTRDNDMLILQNDLHRLIDKEVKILKNALQKEKSERILGFAYRDSKGDVPDKYLILLAMHRCGSTLLMDAIRTHPDVYIEPRAFLHEYTSLKGGRYPADLVGRSDASLDIEQRPGVGFQIPALGSKQQPGPLRYQLSEDSYAIEKIHSEFFEFDTRKFISEIEALEKKKNVAFKFIYQIRDPKSAISSFVKYKRRNSNWYKHIKEENVPDLIYDEYRHLFDFTKLKNGLIVEYNELVNDFEERLRKIFMFLWPERNVDTFQKSIDRAKEFTDRNKRVKTKPTPFLGDQIGTVKGGDVDLISYFETHSEAITNCYDIYNKLKSKT